MPQVFRGSSNQEIDPSKASDAETIQQLRDEIASLKRPSAFGMDAVLGAFSTMATNPKDGILLVGNMVKQFADLMPCPPNVKESAEAFSTALQTWSAEFDKPAITVEPTQTLAPPSLEASDADEATASAGEQKFAAIEWLKANGMTEELATNLVENVGADVILARKQQAEIAKA
jgi:hypothetical protein